MNFCKNNRRLRYYCYSGPSIVQEFGTEGKERKKMWKRILWLIVINTVEK
jgi:hypothetical protein